MRRGDVIAPRRLVWLVIIGQWACSSVDAGAARRTEVAQVDSVVPRAVELARFREGLPEPDGLTGGAPTRDELVRRFVEVLESRDTAGLAAMALTRAEFAYLYYPTARESAPPYDLGPALMWFTLQQNSRTGLFHALDERGGRRLQFVGYSCDGKRVEGENTLWGPCLMRRLQASGDTVVERLFGPIISRGGHYKFVSLSNSL